MLSFELKHSKNYDDLKVLFGLISNRKQGSVPILKKQTIFIRHYATRHELNGCN